MFWVSELKIINTRVLCPRLSVEIETETGVGDNCDWTVDDCLERKFHCDISRLSVIQEADTGPTINILEATPGSAKPVSPTSNNLSNYFGMPQTSGVGAGDYI